MIIKNYNKIATTKLRKRVLEIVIAGIERVHPHNLISSTVGYDKTFNAVTIMNKTYDLMRGRIFVVGGGKAAGFMAERLEEIIGAKNITAGVLNCDSDDYKTKKIEIIKASHPLPDKNGVKGVEKMLALKDEYKINEKDLVICLVSGGGSALLPCPADGVSLKDKQETTQRLLECGADIKEINTIRKHLSKIKGGQLGRHFYPAPVASLIISDVMGNDLDVIASGPTVPDPTTFKDAYSVLVKYELINRIPVQAKNYIITGADVSTGAPTITITGKEKAADRQLGGGETPKSLKNCDNYIIGDVAAALEAMTHKAKLLGLKPIIASIELAGETEAVAIKKAKEIIMKKYGQYNVVLFGGETTPKLPPQYGRGGRNQHYAAVTMMAMEKSADCNGSLRVDATGPGREWAMASMATDGVDYIKGAAGAIIDNNSLAHARDKGLKVVEDYIDRYDTNTLFKKMGDSLIEADVTGTNVGDVVVYMPG